MRGPVVCSSPGGKLWLVLEGDMARGNVKVLDLESGEVVEMSRPLGMLIHYGWRVVEGHEHLEWQAIEG